MSEILSVEAASVRLLSAESVLILTHVKPDGDAVGSVLGMQSFLRSCGKRAEAYFPDPLPAAYGVFGEPGMDGDPQVRSGAWDLILLLDCANPERAGVGPAGLELLRSYPVLNVDHHVDNRVEAAWSWVDAGAAAASLQAAELALASGRPIPVPALECWLLGLVTDTGGFRFSNTDGRALRLAADLLDRGADLEKVVNAVFYSKPRNRQEFEADLVRDCVKLAFDSLLAYAVVPPELFAKHGFDMRDGEGVIDLLREIAGVEIAALAYRKGGAYKLSLRSKDREYPVGPLARSLGGGGHELAAGATLELSDAAAVESLLLDRVGAMLNKR